MKELQEFNEIWDKKVADQSCTAMVTTSPMMKLK